MSQLYPKLYPLWHWLTRPSDKIQDESHQRRASLLAGLQITAIFITLVVIVLAVFTLDDETIWKASSIVVPFSAMVVFLGAYLLLRKGYLWLSINISTIIAIASPFVRIVFYDSTDFSDLYYLIFSILTCSLFYSMRATLLVTALDLLAVLMLYPTLSEERWQELVHGPLLFLSIISMMALIALYYQQQLFNERQERTSTSEARFRSISELTSDYAYAFRITEDGDRIPEWITDAFTRITGYTIENLMASGGLNILVFPEDRPILDQHRETYLTGTTESVEYRIIRKDGAIRWVRVHNQPIWDAAQGRVIRVYGAGQDITEQKEAQEQLRRTEAQKTAILNVIPDLLFRFSSRGDFLDAQFADPEDLVAEPDTYIGRNLRDFVPPNLVELGLYHIERALQTKTMQVYEYDLEIGGEIRHFEARMVVSGEDEVLTIIRNITERKRAQAALHESEVRYRGLVESQQDLIARSTPDRILTFVNDAYCKIMGKSYTELIGSSFEPSIHPDDLEFSRQNLEALQAAPYRVSYEIRNLTTQGWRWIAWEIYGIQDENGSLVEMQGVGRDVTRLKEIEEQLRQRVEELKVLQSLDREMGYTLDVGKVLEIAMQAALDRAGAAACVIGWLDQGENFLSRIAIQGESTLLNQPVLIKKMYGQPDYQELSQVFLDSHISLYTQGDGKPRAFFIPLAVRGKTRGVLALEGLPHSLNETDQDFLLQVAHRTAAALHNVNNYERIQHHASNLDNLYQFSHTLAASVLYDDVIEVSTLALLTLLHGSKALFFDYDRYNHVVTVKEHQPIPKPNSLLNIGVQLHNYPLAEQALAGAIFTLRYNDPDCTEEVHAALGSLAAQSALILPLKDENSLIGILVLCDIMDRFFDAEEIAIVRNLSVQVRVALLRARLVAHLQELERVKSEMIRVASHDLRNPLAQIKGYMELLMDDLSSTTTPLQEEYLSSMERGVHKMRQLLEDILNLERVESYLPSEWQAMSIKAVVLNVTQNLADQAILKRQRYQVELPQDIPPIVGNDIQLEQAFLNLISNAIKYTPEGGEIKVEISVEVKRFVFRVTDNGYGIPQDRQGQLFERFYRAHTPGTEHISGTGLGLSLVKSVVERHGGRVFFESEFGKGSTFGFWLPLKEEALRTV